MVQAGRCANLLLSPLTDSRHTSLAGPTRLLLWPKPPAPSVESALDAFHINIEEVDPHESIRKVGNRLYDFHVADTNRFACGLGHWDWAKLVGTLKSIGYDGALTVEFVAPVDRTPANPYPTMVETDLSRLEISEDQKKFIVDHGSSFLTEEFYSGQVKVCADTLLPLIQ